MLLQGEVLTLNDNKTYSVAYSTTIDSCNYVYLIDQNDYTNNMFCSYENEELKEVIDPIIAEKIIQDFKNNTNNLDLSKIEDAQ